MEELGGDVNAPGVGDTALGATPFMVSAQSGDVATVKYFLDHGGDLVKADDKGRTVLHHAAGIGCCKVTEFLLSKGVPVDIDCGRGTPLFWAASNLFNACAQMTYVARLGIPAFDVRIR